MIALDELYKGQVIRTLGLHQPFATLMLRGKSIETRWIMRGKKPPFPKGVYALYSTSKSYSEDELRAICGHQYDRAMRDSEGDSSHVHNHLILVGELDKLVYVVPSMADETYIEYSERDTHVLVGLVFKNVRRIKPIPFVDEDGRKAGKQGIGFLSGYHRRQIQIYSI